MGLGPCSRGASRVAKTRPSKDNGKTQMLIGGRFLGIDKTIPMLYSKRMAIVVFYRNENGRMPVRESLEELSNPDQAKAAAHHSLLEEYGHTLREPHVKTLKEGLKELRFKISAGQYRIFFFFHVGDTVVLLHTLQKKTQETPKQDIKLALKRIKDWQETHGG
jgi:phage-related protein